MLPRCLVVSALVVVGCFRTSSYFVADWCTGFGSLKLSRASVHSSRKAFGDCVHNLKPESWTSHGSSTSAPKSAILQGLAAADPSL